MHPYAKYASDKAGRAKAKSYQSGGAVGKLPTHPHARGQWERLNMRQEDAQRDHDSQRGRSLLKVVTRPPQGTNFSSDVGPYERRTRQQREAERISDAVPRREED